MTPSERSARDRPAVATPPRPAPRPAPAPDAPRWVRWLRALRRHLVLVVGASAATVLVTYAVVRMMPETFRATASLIVDPAIDPAATRRENEPNILSVPTLQNLLRQQGTTEAVRRLVRIARESGGDPARAAASPLARSLGEAERALLVGAFGAMSEADRGALAAPAADDLLRMPLEDFAKLFEARPTIEKKLAFDVVYSPVIYLDALATSPPLARALANAWLGVFVQLFDELKTRQLQDNRRAVESEYERARGAWEASLAAIRAATSEAQLPVVEARHAGTVAAYEEAYARLAEAERDIAVASGQLEELNAQIDILSDDEGGWIGKVDVQLLLDETATTDVLAGLIEASITARDTGTERPHESLRRRALLSRRELRTSSRALLEFERTNPLDELNLRKADASARLNEALHRRRQLSIEVPATEAALAAGDDLLRATTPTLALRQLLPVEVLAELMMRPDATAAPLPPDAVTYEADVVHPAWATIAEGLAGARLGYNRALPEIALYDGLIIEVMKEITELQADISRYSVQRDLLRHAHEEVQRANGEMYRRFSDLQAESHDVATRIASLEAEVERLRLRLDALLQLSEADYARIQETTNRVSVLNARAEQEKSLTDSLQQQLEAIQIRLSENAREIKIAGFAVTPEEKVFPPRTAISLAAGLFVFLGLVALVIVRDELEAVTAAA